MKNKKIKLVIAVLAVAVLMFLSLPKFLDHSKNKFLPQPPEVQNIRIPELHDQIFIADLHADTLLWNRNLLEESSWGHVDLPRMQRGHVALQAFSVVTDTPIRPNVEKNSDVGHGVTVLAVAQGWPIKTWAHLNERALYQAKKLAEAVQNSNGQLKLILDHESLMRFREQWEQNKKIVGTWLTMEGAQPVQENLDDLDEMYKAGFRMIAPTHLADNEIAGSQSGEKKEGLTEKGRRWLKKMQDKKMVVDLAHASPATVNEILQTTHRPVLISHTGVQAVCNIPRNLSDEQIKKIAAKGGLIGIGLWSQVLCGNTIDLVVKSIKHVCAVVGCQFVAIGSDWDGFVSTVIDSAHMGWLTAELVQAGFSDKEIAGIMGENTFQFLLENLP